MGYLLFCSRLFIFSQGEGDTDKIKIYCCSQAVYSGWGLVIHNRRKHTLQYNYFIIRCKHRNTIKKRDERHRKGCVTYETR